jgi:hypothetical protein
MFAKFCVRGRMSATLLFSFLNLVPTQVSAESPLMTTRAEYLPLEPTIVVGLVYLSLAVLAFDMVEAWFWLDSLGVR